MSVQNLSATNANALRRIRAVIADHRPNVRHGLAALLQSQDDLEMVRVVATKAVALEALQCESVDLAILAVSSGPRVLELATLVTMRQVAPACRILLVCEAGHDEACWAAIHAGAQGCIDVQTDAVEILRAVRTVAAGGQAFPRRFADRLPGHRTTWELSSREREVLQLVARGLTNREVAGNLNISQFTVRNHLNHIVSKLEVSDRSQAVFVAAQAGMITPPFDA